MKISWRFRLENAGKREVALWYFPKAPPEQHPLVRGPRPYQASRWPFLSFPGTPGEQEAGRLRAAFWYLEEDPALAGLSHDAEQICAEITQRAQCWVRGVRAKLPPYSRAHSGSCRALVSSTRLHGRSPVGLGSWSDALQSVILEQELRFKKDGPTFLLYFSDT